MNALTTNSLDLKPVAGFSILLELSPPYRLTQTAEAVPVPDDLAANYWVIHPGTTGEEWNTQGKHAKSATDLPTLCEFWYGTALVYLQTPLAKDVTDVLTLRPQPGNSVVIPAGWAYAIYNIHPEDPVAYATLTVPTSLKGGEPSREVQALREWDGLAHRVLQQGTDGFTFDLNLKYRTVPLPREATVPDLAALGVQPGQPVLVTLQQNPEAFRWLLHPDEFSEALQALYAEEEW